MNKAFSLLTGLLICCQAIIAQINPIASGTEIPMKEVAMKDISGKSVSITDAMKGNGVLVIFMCNTCPYVIKNQDRISNLTDITTKFDIGMIAINSNEAFRENEDSYEAMKTYANEIRLNCAYVLDTDNKLADAFGAKRTPECFLFDKNMKLVYHGAIDDNPNDANAVKRNHLAEAMNEIFIGKEVSMKETQSIGCGIKRKKKV
jgi:hypothetical protein